MRTSVHDIVVASTNMITIDAESALRIIISVRRYDDDDDDDDLFKH